MNNDGYQGLVLQAWNDIMECREKLVKAFLAEFGVLPSQAVLFDCHVTDGRGVALGLNRDELGWFPNGGVTTGTDWAGDAA